MPGLRVLRRSIQCALLVLMLSAGLTQTVWAQDNFPNRQIKFLVGFATGGPTDVIARVLAKEMSLSLGQPVVVENKPGASSMIATRQVRGSAPDGYTLLFSSLGLNVNPLLVGDQAGYNPRSDFVPVSNAAVLPLVVVAAQDSPLRTIQDLIRQASSRPEAITFGSSGNGGSGHLAGELLGTLIKSKMLHVPFKGNGPALIEVMAGRVDFMFYPVIGIADQVAARRLRVLAVGTPRRLPQFADAPTMAESGFPGFEETAPWVGLLAPAGTPAPVVAKLHESMARALAKPEVKAQLERLGAVIVGDTPAEFAAFLQRDYERWERVVKAAAIKVDLN